MDDPPSHDHENEDQDAEPKLPGDGETAKSSCDQQDEHEHDGEEDERTHVSSCLDEEYEARALGLLLSTEPQLTAVGEKQKIVQARDTLPPAWRQIWGSKGANEAPSHNAEFPNGYGVRDEQIEVRGKPDPSPLPTGAAEGSYDDAYLGSYHHSLVEQIDQPSSSDIDRSDPKHPEEAFVPPRLDDFVPLPLDEKIDKVGDEAPGHQLGPPPSSDGGGAGWKTGSEDGGGEDELPAASGVGLDASGSEAFEFEGEQAAREGVAATRTFKAMPFGGRDSSSHAPSDVVEPRSRIRPASSTINRALLVSGRDREIQAVIDSLAEVYRRKLKPVEGRSLFHKFHPETLSDAELQAKPQVLLLGQTSSSKTTIIRELIGRHVPDLRAESFRVVMAGAEERNLGGPALCISDDLPYAGLTKFGASFLGKFYASVLPSPLLEHVNFVEAPSTLPFDTGEGHGGGPDYPYGEVVNWFADRSDLILLVFEAQKLDVPEEFRQVMAAVMAQHGDRVRVVLNKGHDVEVDRLIKVQGALMWTLGRCLRGRATPPRVYVVGFGSSRQGDRRRDPPPRGEEDADSLGGNESFEFDEAALRGEIYELPKNTWIRKMDVMMQRARLVKTHLKIVSAVRARLPRLSILWGVMATQDFVLASLGEIFDEIKAGEGVCEGDLPSLENYRRKLRWIDLRDLPRQNQRLVAGVDDIIERDIKQCITRAGGVRGLYKLDPPGSNSSSMSMSSRGLRRRKRPGTDHGDGHYSPSSGRQSSSGGTGLNVPAILRQGGRDLRKRLSKRGGWSRDLRDGTPDDTDDEALQQKEGGGGRIEAGDRGSDDGVPTWVMILVMIAVVIAAIGVTYGLRIIGASRSTPSKSG